MNKTRLVLLGACSVLLASTPLYAQTGCFHSPEAPTDVLMVVGAAGMFYGSGAVRNWLGRRRKR